MSNFNRVIYDRLPSFSEIPLEARKSYIDCVCSDYGIPRIDEYVDAFCVAPASSKYHGNYEGGLLDHSLNVACVLDAMTRDMQLEWQNDRSPILVGMYHDICKFDNYIITDSEILKAEAINLGHGDRSVELLKKIIPDLTEEEEFCIRWHMGAFDDKVNWKFYGEAVEKYPNVLFTHTADMIASRILERSCDNPC